MNSQWRCQLFSEAWATSGGESKHNLKRIDLVISDAPAPSVSAGEEFPDEDERVVSLFLFWNVHRLLQIQLDCDLKHFLFASWRNSIPVSQHNARPRNEIRADPTIDCEQNRNEPCSTWPFFLTPIKIEPAHPQISFTSVYFSWSCATT